MTSPLIIDNHVHLAASGVSGCALSPRYRRGIAFRILRRVLGLTASDEVELSAQYAAKLTHLMDGAAGLLDGAVLLAMDGIYDSQGRLDLSQTSMYVTNDYCFEVCARDPRFLPAASVNPARRDALDELDRVAALGAVCVKTIANSQRFDPLNPAFAPFWQRMADLKLPWLNHTGREHTIPSASQRYGDPDRLRPALDQGVTVIAAHAGSAGVRLPGMTETFHQFVALLDQYPNLYGDISAFTSFGRSQYFAKALARPHIHDRLIYGSDFPIPSSPLTLAASLGWSQARALSRAGNPLTRALLTARAMRTPDAIFTRADQVLRISDDQRAALRARWAEA
jgi:predicted TIM-barrel fold metal-dependent hydrolase